MVTESGGVGRLIETHMGVLLTNFTQLHTIATIIQLFIRSLERQSEVGNVLEGLLIVHSLHISNSFDLCVKENTVLS